MLSAARWTVLLLFFVMAPALAATPAPLPASPAPLPAAPPPYEEELLRLAEILGAVHYLAQLCDSPNDETWREQMQKLVDTEEGDARARMVDRFNRGYDSYRSVYLSCTPAASEANQRYLSEGAKIAQDITARYGK